MHEVVRKVVKEGLAEARDDGSRLASLYASDALGNVAISDEELPQTVS